MNCGSTKAAALATRKANWRSISLTGLGNMIQGQNVKKDDLCSHWSDQYPFFKNKELLKLTTSNWSHGHCNVAMTLKFKFLYFLMFSVELSRISGQANIFISLSSRYMAPVSARLQTCSHILLTLKPLALLVSRLTKCNYVPFWALNNMIIHDAQALYGSVVRLLQEFFLLYISIVSNMPYI